MAIGAEASLVSACIACLPGPVCTVQVYTSVMLASGWL